MTVRGRRTPVFLVAMILVSACGRGTTGDRASTTRLEDVLAFERTIDLEENEAVVNVSPLVSVDTRGGFLIADSREAQVRRYERSGELLWHVGSRGRGPGEFTQPRAAVRGRSGAVVVFDQSGRVTIFDSTGTHLLNTLATEFRFVEDVEVLDRDRFLVAALHREGIEGPRIHLWNLERDSVIASFFAPLPGARNRVAATIAGWTKLSLRGDTVAAIFALSDSIHLFTAAGASLGTIPIPFAEFRRVGREVPEGGNDPQRRERWLSSFDYVGDVHWLRGGDLLVPYQSIVPGGAYTRDWHLARMTRAGDRVFELRNVPRLLTVDENDGLYFIAPGAEEPSRWTFARFR